MNKKIMFHSQDIEIFVFLWNLQIQNLWCHNKHCGISYTDAYFFWILSTIKKNFGQLLVCSMLNISYKFWAEYWRLETSSRLFYDSFKMTIQQDLAIFNGWYLPFLNVSYSPFQKNATLESWNNWLLSNWGRFLNEKGPETQPHSPPKCSKDY